MPCPHLKLIVAEGESPELIPGWTVLSCSQEGERLAFSVTHPYPGQLGLFVGPKLPDTPAFATTDSFSIWYNTRGGFPADSPEVERFMKAAVERIRLHDDGTVRLQAGPVQEVSRSGPDLPPEFAQAPAWLLTSAAGLYVLGLLGLAALVWLCARKLAGWAPATLAGLAAILLASALVRFLVVPFALVKVGMFHPLMDSAVGLSWLPRYGAGGPVLYHALFLLFPVHTDTVLRFHAVLSLLCVVPMVLLARDLLRLGDAASLLLAAMLALTPVFLRDGNSESMLVPAMLFLAGGLLLVREAKGVLLPLAGIPLLALAPYLRPELLLMVPALAAVFLLPDLQRAGRGQRLAVTAGAWIMLVVPAAIFALLATVGEVEKGEILLSRLSPVRVLDGLVLLNLVLRPSLFPAAIPLLALASVALSIHQGTWARRVGLLAVALSWIALYSLDMNEDSMLRLHVPAAMLLVMLAADGAQGVLHLFRRKLGGVDPAPTPVRVLVPAAAALLWAGAAVPTVPNLFAPTDTVIQDAIFLAAMEKLPAEDVDIVVLGGEDAPRHALSPESLGRALENQIAFSPVHRHYPVWRISPPWRNDRVLPISAYRAQGHANRRTFFFLSAQCYATRDARGEDEWDVTLDPYRSIHPACRFVLTHNKLVPVHVQWTPHFPERSAAFQWYPDGLEGMTLGLFEIAEPLQEPCPADSLTRAAEWYLSEAQAHIEDGDEAAAEAAIAAGEEALRDSPAMLEFLASFNYWVGNTHKDLERLDRSLAYWDRIARRDIHYPFLLSKVGAVFAVRAQFFEKAQLKEYIDQHLAKRPDDKVALYLSGLYLFYYEQDYTGSLAGLSEVMRTVPDDPRVHLYMALDHFYLGHKEEAERLIARGIELSSGKDPDVYYVRSIIIRGKNMDLAVEDIQRYIDMSQGKEKVKKPEKEAWLRQELERLRKGEPSDWWRSTKPDEPWVKKGQ